jgi:predicted component of viral defense system (DUF524 family)
VGRLPVSVVVDDVQLLEVAFEVRSVKLDYLNQYRWMLRDIAEHFTEAVMDRFAATETKFTVDESSDARTLYEKFAFLRSLLRDEQFQSAIRLIINEPHIAWNEIREPRSPGRGIRASSRLARELVKPGPRFDVTDADLSWPTRIDAPRTEESLDNPPNRFVKFALNRWRAEVVTIRELLETKEPSATVIRGVQEAKQVIDELDQFLAAPMFAEVASTQVIPTANPVLLRKEGYRELLRAFIQFEMAARLAWEGGEEVYGAGQRNVATLFEYWCFLQLFKVVSELCDSGVNTESLFQLRTDGLNLLLSRGKEALLRGRIARFGRPLNVELCFNRSFPRGTSGKTSWSKPMRPDCSIRISDELEHKDSYKTVWLHFDAKYRADRLIDLFGSDETSGDNDTVTATAKRDDLLKMHAYRDSIRRSAGAYVMYPGDQAEQFSQYHELLPGLGAFALRPAENGDANGLEVLKQFLSDVLQHTASQYTQHERSRYWNEVSFRHKPAGPISGFVAPFLSRPPDDVTVLIGYVKSEAHLEWVIKNRLYNLRADRSRRGSVAAERTELSSDFVLLYGDWSYKTFLMKIAGPPLLLDAQRLTDIEYPMPGGNEYLCLPVDDVSHDSTHFEISLSAINRLRVSKGLQRGLPFSISWAELIDAASHTGKELYLF